MGGFGVLQFVYYDEVMPNEQSTLHRAEAASSDR
jgi:hypothetical protein